MEQFTTDRIGMRVAFLIEGEIIAAPIVEGVISDGLVIDGHWDDDEVGEILRRVRSDW